MSGLLLRDYWKTLRNMTDNTNTTPCPVCGKQIKAGNMIFHMRKAAVFEIYKAYKEKTLGNVILNAIAPHEAYIIAHTKQTDVFEM